MEADRSPIQYNNVLVKNERPLGVYQDRFWGLGIGASRIIKIEGSTINVYNKDDLQTSFDLDNTSIQKLENPHRTNYNMTGTELRKDPVIYLNDGDKKLYLWNFKTPGAIVQLLRSIKGLDTNIEPFPEVRAKNVVAHGLKYFTLFIISMFIAFPIADGIISIFSLNGSAASNTYSVVMFLTLALIVIFAIRGWIKGNQTTKLQKQNYEDWLHKYWHSIGT